MDRKTETDSSTQHEATCAHRKETGRQKETHVDSTERGSDGGKGTHINANRNPQVSAALPGAELPDIYFPAARAIRPPWGLMPHVLDWYPRF